MEHAESVCLVRLFCVPLYLDTFHGARSLAHSAAVCASSLQAFIANNDETALLPILVLAILVASEPLHEFLEPLLALIGDIVEDVFRLAIST